MKLLSKEYKEQPASVLITCEHADFGYENIDALSDVNIEIQEGDYIGIVGGNGSGKSTLLKGLLGLLKPTSGKITFAPELKKAGIGYLPQVTPAQKDFPATVYEVVLSGNLGRRGNRPFYSKADKERTEFNIRRLGIDEMRDRCFRELSGGQKQRVLIARALCATDKLLILDEPITGLDPAAIQDLYHLVKKLNREERVTIIMVSHDMSNIIHQANKILHLHKKVQFWGTTKDYLRSPAGRAFLSMDDMTVKMVYQKNRRDEE